MVRREIFGIVLLSLVVGMLVMGLLVMLKPEEDVSLISSTIPSRFDRSVGSKPIFSLGLVSGRDLADLRLRFAVMFEAEPSSWLGRGISGVKREDLEKWPTGLVPVDLWLEEARKEDLKISPQAGSVTVNGSNYGAYIYDFRDLAAGSGSKCVFAALFEDGNISKVYWGFGEFFVEPTATISSFKVELEEGVKAYSKDPRGEEEPIDLMPEGGEVVLGSVKRDDQILVTMVLEGHTVPVQRSWLWTCMAVVDGRIEALWIFSTL